MLQQDAPDDYVVATGVAHSVRDCLRDRVRPGRTRGRRPCRRSTTSLKRPAEVDHLIGDASKARRELGWEPRTSFEELIRLMVDADYELLSRGVSAARAQLGRARSEATSVHRLALGVADRASSLGGRSLPASPVRTARSWPSCCSSGATRSPAWSAPAERAARLLRAPARPDRAGRRRRPARSREPARPRWTRSARTSSTTWRRRRSSPTRGGDPAETLAAIAGVDRDAARGGARRAARHARVRRRPRARCSAPRPRALSARTPPAGRRRRTRPRSSPRTSWSASFAPTTACSPAPGSSTTTSPSADPSSS